jgi:uncharacterized membrane protein (DUF4010 family)
VRLLGPRFGLPIAGLASGFISSTATIGAMGGLAIQEPALARPAVAGAVLSTVATILQMTALLAATNTATLHQMRFPLIAGGIAALAYGALLTFLSVRQKAVPPAQSGCILALLISRSAASGVPRFRTSERTRSTAPLLQSRGKARSACIILIHEVSVLRL